MNDRLLNVDWKDVRIGNFVIRGLPAQPLRLRSADYEQAVALTSCAARVDILIVASIRHSKRIGLRARMAIQEGTRTTTQTSASSVERPSLAFVSTSYSRINRVID